MQSNYEKMTIGHITHLITHKFIFVSMHLFNLKVQNQEEGWEGLEYDHKLINSNMI